MKKYICILLFGLFSAVMFGQPTYQHRMDTAIDIGTHDSLLHLPIAGIQGISGMIFTGMWIILLTLALKRSFTGLR